MTVPNDTLFSMEPEDAGNGAERAPASRQRRTTHQPVGPAPLDPVIASRASQLSRRIRLGTSSWSFPGWRGLVWDRESSEPTLARSGLAAYAAHPLLRCVGIDKTFYRPPAVEDLAAMARQVPEEFRFLMKAPESVVSPSPRHGPGRFLDAAYTTHHVVAPFVEGLGSRGGPLLFQFPPLGIRSSDAAARMVDSIGDFLDQLPPGPLYAVEVRDRLLLGESYRSRLCSARVAHCYSVHPSMPPPLEQARTCPPEPGTPLVCRWMLHGGQTYDDAIDRYQPFDRLVDPDERSRSEFAAMLERAAAQGRDCFLIANNKAEGSAPITLALLAEAILARGNHATVT